MHLLSLLSAFVTERVHAQPAMTVICNGLPGCGQGPENALFFNVLPLAVRILIQLAAGLSVVFIIISGVRMVLSYGDDSKAGAGKKGIIYSLIGLAVSLSSASLISFVSTEDYGQGFTGEGAGGFLLVGIMASVVRIIMRLFNAGFVIMIMLGGLRMVLASGSPDEFKKGGAVIKWAIVGAVVVNLAHALVRALVNIGF